MWDRIESNYVKPSLNIVKKLFSIITSATTSTTAIIAEKEIPGRKKGKFHLPDNSSLKFRSSSLIVGVLH